MLGNNPLWSGSGWPGAPGDRGARDTTSRRACSGSPGSPAGVSVRTPAGFAELTSTCPETHAGWLMDDGLWIENQFSLVFQSHSWSSLV
jgi:hypothetical protein